MCTTAASPSMGSALFGATTFCAKQHGPDECDSKGLPLTLHSINIVGKFQRLRSLYHPNLCVYLDAKKLKTERVVLVSEWYNDSLENHIKSSRFVSTSSLAGIAKQVLSALSILEEKGIMHRSLASDNILVTPEGNVKLFNYGLYYMTGCGKSVNFPIGSPRYMAPEVVMAESSNASSPKVDVWSLGIILLELFMETPIYPDLFLRNALGTLFKRLVLLSQNFQRKSLHPLDALLESHGSVTKELNADFRSFLLAALNPIPSERPSASSLLTHAFITDHAMPQRGGHSRSGGSLYPILTSPFQSIVRCSLLPIQTANSQEGGASPAGTTTSTSDHIRERPLQEVYYLWSLAGGDLELEMKKVGLIPSKPPIFSVPSLVTSKGVPYGMSKDRVTLYDSTVVQLSLDQLDKRLEEMTTAEFYPLLVYNEDEHSGPLTPHDHTLQDTAKLPLAIKENDVEYQFHRVVMYSRLLESYPHSQALIQKEASTDISPLRRGEIWAALLDVNGDLLWQYNNIDKDSWTPTDRQIEVDIPRCHQYDTLLSSSSGHQKFKRVLKAWVVTHPLLVYWQGLDSLCAPFLALNFNNEELAYASLSAFIDRFLHKFFMKDNSAVMQEYLAVFSQLIAFHDPELYNHLDSSGFSPELYAIPWFLTMFTHILPLDKIYHLWDTMLLGNSSFPLFVGLSILQQLRSDLLDLAFNECILLFSDMPVVDIQSCIQTAVRLFQATPVSTYMRKHQVGPIHSESIPPEADRQPFPVPTLRTESCPQISAHDLISLCRLEPQTQLYGRVSKSTQQQGSSSNKGSSNKGSSNKGSNTGSIVMDGNLLLNRTPTKTGKKSRRAMVIDIRSNEEFRLGHVQYSISIPHSSAFLPDGSLNPGTAASTLGANYRSRVIVVVGNKGESAPIFARQLVRLKFPKVCVLYGGAGVLRTLGVLTSIQDDL